MLMVLAVLGLGILQVSRALSAAAFGSVPFESSTSSVLVEEGEGLGVEGAGAEGAGGDGTGVEGVEFPAFASLKIKTSGTT